MKRQPTRTLLLIVLALAFRAGLCGESLLEEDPSAVSLPLEFEINGSSQGEVIVRSDSSLQIVEIQGSTLKELLAGRVTKDLVTFVDSLPEGFHTLESFQELGLEIRLDLERLVISLQIQEKNAYEDAGPKRISLGYQHAPNFASHTKPAFFSGYANLRLRSTHSAHSNAAGSSKTLLGISHVLNLNGYAIEGESLWNDSSSFQTRELRLVKDLPDRLWRISAGDISTPINDLQRGYQLFGISLTKEFGIQPYRTFTPTSGASFQLTEASTIRVTVNGSQTRTMRLEPGNYSIEDFKLAAGPNNMELQIENGSGLVDTVSVNEFGALSLLDSGVSTYSLSYGFPRTSPGAPESSEISSANWYQRSIENQAIFSSYYKRGLTNQITLSLDAQGSSEWNRIGASAYTASERFGTLNLSLSHNQTDKQDASLSSRLTWAHSFAGYNISLSSTYSGETYNLTTASQTPSPQSLQTSNSLSISKLIRGKINVSTSFLRQTRYDGVISQNVNASFGGRMGKIYTALSFRYTSDRENQDYGSFLTVTWNPAKQWRTRTQARYSTQPGGTQLVTNMDYSNRRADDYINTRIDATYSDSGYDIGGSVDYQAGLYSASLSHSQVYGDIDDFVDKGSDTAIELQSAIAFADGAFGFANQVRNSFAIVDKHPAWSQVQLGINPTVGGFEKRSTNSVVSPVLNSLAPYRETYATVQTVNSDLFLERNDYYFFPSYKRGIKLRLGSDAIYSIRASLNYFDQEPVKYKAIRFTSQSGDKVDTFTNGAGRFMATGLKPGNYHISVANTEETLIVTIPEGETMLVMGKLALNNK